MEPTVTFAEFLAARFDGSPESAKTRAFLPELLKLCLRPEPPEKLPDEFWEQTKETPEKWEEVLRGLSEAIRIGSVPREHAKDVLRRLGPCGDLDDHNEYWTRLWAQARVNNFSTEEFWSLSPREFFAVLDAKLADREYRNQASSQRTAEMKRPNRRMGRPKGTVVDRAKLRAFRGRWSQEDFADKCDVTVSTIQRGEAGDRWDDGTFSKVANALTTLTGTTVTADDLKNPKK